MKYLDDTEKKDLRQDTYKATRAVAGLEPVITRGTDQPIEGLISQITGSQPKAGFFLSKIIDKKQDLVGRGVITAAPDYHVDQLGVPEKMAWKIFSPFIIREYTSSGIGADVARKEMEQKTPRAKQMLESVMRKRTVLLNRAPSLHKFSIMAFKPVLTDGLTLKIPPLVLKGFSGDFDGDACTVHVPTSEEALRESYKMLPSNNLFKPGTGELMMVPTQEAAIGLYFLSHTPEGRKKINSILPQKFHINGALDKAEAGVLYNKIGKEDPKSYSNLVHELKKLGDHEAYERGFTVGLKDTVVDTKGRDRNFAQADLEVAKLKRLHKTGPELDKQVAAVYQKAAKTSFDEIQDNLKKSGNSFYHMVRSGARGNPAQLQQIITAPGIVEDSKSRPVPVPLKTSYAEGLKTSDYFVASYGVRKGMMDKSLQTSAPGALNKDIRANTIDNIITLHDCGTKHGIEMSIDSHDLKDRVILSGKFKDQVVTPQIISALKKGGDKTVTVRSPLKCIAEKGTCAKCYGHDEFGVLPSIGDNVGARCGQAMSEPLTQLSMKTFHTGGMAGADPGAAGFERVRQLLHMPKGHVTGEAAYAKVSGKVTKITKSPVGGYSVHIGDKIHPVPFGRELKVREGDKVSIGDPLSTGVMKPQVVKEFKGMEKAQDYLVDELHKTFAGSKGISPIERRVFETVVRSVGNNTEVVKAPKHANFLPGDVIPYTTAVHYNESRKETLPVNDTVGYHLSHPVGHLPIHHEISDKDIPYLKASGYNKLDVLKDPLIHAPMIKGVERLSKTKKNWMAQLGYRYIENTLTDGAAEAWKSQISGTHPIPAYAVGTGFGKKKESY
jgi:DNA-directed RNA polymerase subunit beta'